MKKKELDYFTIDGGVGGNQDWFQNVVMYMGDGRIIHSTAKAGADGVVINSLRPGDIGFAEHLYGEISCAGSIFG